MRLHLCATVDELGARAAAAGAAPLRAAIAGQGAARIILATGASQFATLAALVDEPEIDWSRVTIFHLDEYAGLPDSHPASFRRYPPYISALRCWKVVVSSMTGGGAIVVALVALLKAFS